MSLAEKQKTMIEELRLIEDEQERLAVVVDRVRTRTALPPEERTEDNRVKGCVSAVWVTSQFRGGRCYFRGDADSPLVRGLVVLLCDLYSGASPGEVAAVEPAVLEAAGLLRSLSPTRLNGLRSVRARIRDFAGAHAPG